MDPAFAAAAKKAGVSPELTAFLWEYLAQKPHTHTSDEIVVDGSDGETLDQFVDAVSEALSELEEEESEEGEEEEEEDEEAAG